MSNGRADLPPLSKVATAKITKDIRETIAKIEDMQKQKAQLKLIVKPRQMSAKLGVFPPRVYKHGTIIVQDNNMTKLPNEILIMTIKKLADPERTVLALTCKENCALVAAAKMLEPKPAKPRSISKEHRLAVLVRLHEWMPAGFKLCYACVKFLPTNGNGPWRGDVAVRNDTKRPAGKKAIETGPRCKMCAKREDIDMVKARSDAQKLLRLVRNM